MVRLTGLQDLPNIADAASDALNRIFDGGADVILRTSRVKKVSPPLLNIPIEAGKAITLDFGVTIPRTIDGQEVKAVHFASEAVFSHGARSTLRATFEPYALAIRAGRCKRDER